MNGFNVWQIAVYEMKVLLRDWGFRIVFGLSVALIFFLHFLVQGNMKIPEWIAVSLPSAIPFANAYLVNYVQIVIGLFWGISLINKDQLLSSDSSIAVRPFSNSEYLWGKVFGFILVIFILDVSLTLVALIVHLFLSESPFVLFPYIFYLFTLTLPVLVFVVGTIVFVKSWVSSRVLTLGILLVSFYLIVHYSSSFLFGLFDVFPSELPNVFSDVVGFSGLSVYLVHRAAILLLGMGLLFIGIISIKRIPNDSKSRRRGVFIGLMFVVCACFCGGMYVNCFVTQQKAHEKYRAIFVKYEDLPRVQIVEHDVQFRQVGNGFVAESRIKLCNLNDRTVNSIMLYLNPRLIISDLLVGGVPVKFRRDEQIVLIEHALTPDEEGEVFVRYEGSIDPGVCYAEVENLDSDADHRSYSIFRMGRDFYYLEPEFTLLTPECLWYPASVPPVNVKSPFTTQQDYVHFSLVIIGEKERIPLSQGVMEVLGDSTRFRNTRKLTGLSVCIGPYTRRVTDVDDKCFELYLLKGHEYLADQFTDSKELIGIWQNNITINKDMDYRFNKLALVEVPVHFCAYSRNWRGNSEYVQPELVFRPEREALGSRFTVGRMGESGGITVSGDGISPDFTCFWQYLNNFGETRPLVKGNFLFGHSVTSEDVKNEYDLSSFYQKNHFYVYSSDFDGINLLLQKINSRWELAFSSCSYPPSFNYAVDLLRGQSLEEVLRQPLEAKMIDDVVKAKSIEFQSRLLARLPYESVREFIQEYIKQYDFSNWNYEQFCRRFQEELGIDLHEFTRNIYNEKGIPSFIVRDGKIEEYETTDGKRGYVQSVKVWNRGNVDGVINFSTYSHPNFYCEVPAGKSQEIRVNFDNFTDKFDLEIQLNLSENNPSSYNFKNALSETIIKEPRLGVFDVDTTYFLPPSNEYIVDDRDVGFRVVEHGRVLKNAKRWEFKFTFEGGYGEPIQGRHVKPSGEGSLPVEWNVVLPQEGEYELFVYNDGVAVERMMKASIPVKNGIVKRKSPVQTYTFSHRDGASTVSLEENELLQSGWISLGTYYFSAGENKVSLTDRGADQFQRMFADAVKWVKRP